MLFTAPDIPEVRDHFGEAFQCLHRLQNFISSLRVEELIAEPQNLEDLIEPLDREHKILSQLLSAMVSNCIIPTFSYLRALDAPGFGTAKFPRDTLTNPLISTGTFSTRITNL
jgi:hypothetical protein